ncbi:putative MFS transporter, AGZA family, xanthine/uracil permease [Quadrisphaera granulorum]|uniref:AGZA family xanthine/uracil permease-like MFS transporter n=1 Tax=Quadrisphaera granulorum TaxID=317664 RepID=A0A315ZX71_9ACTN|nr:regulator [Quadrisphaera granulorum]PWJ49899.1 AGZA family xanthine/uracil permease-like MFS transporter [Quadrisphaera granulorum]SZE98107.1 putative MFS transporter, AGZA family, xanthine/uracil permease [Quadrisphaera granulorum]
MSTTSTASRVPLWTRGDTNAFFGLAFNILVNVLTLTGLMIGVVGLAAGDVLGTVLPAIGVAMVLGNVFYTWLALRLAKREGRSDVTALPYGPSVPHMFIVVFVIMLPIALATKDPVRAWEAGLAWAFVIGIIVLIGAFVGPWIRKITPRAAMLGTLAGISLTFIAMRPAAQIWEAAWIGLPVLAVILIGFVAGVRLPGGVPVGLAALLLGTAIGWIGGYMSVPDVSAAARDIALAVPHQRVDLLLAGLSDLAPLLATAIPLGVYNFTEAMSNVESAAAAGDDYDLRSVLLADGAGAVVGAALGSPFPPAVYIGHPGWKAAGGRVGYSMASGLVIGLLCFLGLFGLLSALLPLPAIVPILLFIGLLIGAQAFRATPRVHAAAVVIAIVPNAAAWASGLIDNALAAAGTSAAEVGNAALASAGVVYEGLLTLGHGAVLAGMVLGAITVFIIDRRFAAAAVACGVGAALSFIGLIHAAQVGWAAAPQVALGYLLFGAVCAGFWWLQRARGEQPTPAPEVDENGDPVVPAPRTEVDLTAERERAAASTP